MITPQKQIVVQDIMQTLVDNLPEFIVNEKRNVSKKCSFSFGKEEELNRYLKATNSQDYPLIWLLPSKNTNDITSNIVKRRVSIIIATLEENSDYFNVTRYERSFKPVLFPIRDYLVHSLRNSGATRLIGSEVDTYEFPNYVKDDGAGNIDKWDAIRIECDVDFIRDKCIKSFTWTT